MFLYRKLFAAVTQSDHQEAIEDSIPECDMHTSIYSTRSNRSNSIDLMSRSVYGIIHRKNK